MKKTIYITVALLIAVALLSACSGTSSDSSDNGEDASIEQTDESTAENAESEPTAEQTEDAAESGSIIEPEQLISAEEAAQLIGEAVGEGEKSEQAVVGQKICMYSAADEDSFSFIQIALTQQAFMQNSTQTPQSIYDSIVSAFNGGEAVEGIGDSAVFATPGIHIMSNGYYISIGAGNSDDEAVREILRQAGALAVQNLEDVIN